MPSRRHSIADDLRNQITTGRLKPGERLASETQLAAQYKVSTATLRSALAVLQGEGQIEKIHGKGNFVRRSLHRITYVGGYSTREQPQIAPDPALRITVRTTKIRARGELTGLLRVPTGSPLTEFLCLSYEAESPHSLARIYIPRDLAPAAVLNDPRRYEGATERFAALHPASAEIRETVSARLPTPEEASILRISSALAVLAITRVTADDITGRVVEAALLMLPGDRADAVFTTNHVIDEGQAER
ncbi:GntR family transcriptional regulator [Streptomyces sp. NPDC002855]|uniref:GntR family transcriptional regulator n=1 Tax=Streptomyces sp. NPDC002855 TaxID=3154437 RepID=UPI003329E8C9